MSQKESYEKHIHHLEYEADELSHHRVMHHNHARRYLDKTRGFNIITNEKKELEDYHLQLDEMNEINQLKHTLKPTHNMTKKHYYPKYTDTNKNLGFEPDPIPDLPLYNDEEIKNADFSQQNTQMIGSKYNPHYTLIGQDQVIKSPYGKSNMRWTNKHIGKY